MITTISGLKTSIKEKFEQLKNQNLNPDVAKNLGDWLRMELTYTSNAIEGNTLTRQETMLVLDEGISIGGKSVTEILEVKNHKRALELVIELAKSKKIQDLNQRDLLEIHQIILEGIDYNNSGKYRSVPVRIAGSMTILPNYLKVPDLMALLFKKVNCFEKASSIIDLIDLAISVHYDLVTIHPFVDGNGRTARLMFNLILLQGKLPLAFITKEERRQYLNSLEKVQTGGSSDDYNLLMFKAIDRSLDLYLAQGDVEVTESSMNKLYKIGQIAKLSNEQIPTIRHWMSINLLKPFNTTPAGYALFNSSTLDIIKQIRHLQTDKRLSLEEIRSLIK